MLAKEVPSFVGRLVRLTPALLLFPLLFTACLEEVDEVATPQIEALPQTAFQLAHAPTDWVTVEGKANVDPEDESLEKRATRKAGNDRGRFNITLKYLIPPTPEQEAVFEEAAARWERIIIKDLPSFTGVLPSAFLGVPPAVDGTLDDLVIEVVLAPIDGPGNVLGQAGPRFIRTASGLPLSGLMFFDVADLDFLDQLDLFEEVIVHEMGHVLGVGTLWDFGDRDLRKDEEGNPYFAGRKANVFWNAEGGTGELPVENAGGPGTRLGHWRESVLDNELMTGFLNLGENPLSRITAGSMRDLGYGASSVGESYDLPRGTAGVDVDGEEPGAGLNIGEMEVTLAPIGSVTVK